MSAFATSVLFDIYNIRAVINLRRKSVNNQPIYETLLENTITGQSFIISVYNDENLPVAASDALAFGRAAIEHSREAEQTILSLRAEILDAANDLTLTNEDAEVWNFEGTDILNRLLTDLQFNMNLLLPDSEYRTK